MGVGLRHLPSASTGRGRAAPRLDNRSGEVQSIGAGFSRRMFLEFDLMNRRQRRAAAKQGGYIGRHSTASASNATADLFNAALRYHRSGRLAEAELLYGQVLAIEPGHARSLHNLGNILRETGRADEAVTCYQRALTLEPKLVETRSNLAATLQDLGRLDQAISHYQEVLALDPENAEIHCDLLPAGARP